MDAESTEFDELVRDARSKLARSASISDDLPETPHGAWRNWLRILLPSLGVMAASYLLDSDFWSGAVVCLLMPAGVTVGIVNFLTKSSRVQSIEGGCLAIGWLLALATILALGILSP